MAKFFEQVTDFFSNLTASSAKKPPRVTGDPFEELTRHLVTAIPTAVRKFQLVEPVSALLVYYYDTQAPEAYLELKPVEQSYQQQVVTQEGRDAPFTLWAPGEEKGNLPTATLPHDDSHPAAGALFQRIYERLSEDGHEEEAMRKYRAAIHQTTLQLNQQDWSKVCPVTEDFVVVPADGSQAFADTYEDLTGGVPEDRLDRLRQQGLLGPGESWDQLPE